MESEDNAERRFDAPLHAGGKDTLLIWMPVTGNVTLTVAILSSARWREIVDHIQYVGLIITACLVSPHFEELNGEHNTTPMYSEC